MITPERLNLLVMNLKRKMYKILLIRVRLKLVKKEKKHMKRFLETSYMKSYYQGRMKV